MKITPTPITAALAGIFSALVWPLVNPPGSAFTVELMLATLLVIALPAHAFVVGFGQQQALGMPKLDTALLVRVAAWLASAAATAIAAASLRAA
jgi:hypothetical protein